MGTKKDIGTVFKETMSNYTATPNGVWQSIENELKRQRRRKLFLLWLLCFLVLIPSGFILYKYTTPSLDVESNEVILPEKPIKKDIHTTLQDSDTLTNQEKENTSLTQIAIQKVGIKIANRNKKNTISKKTNKNQEGQDVILLLEKLNFVKSSLIMQPVMMNKIQQDSLEIVLQNPTLGKKKELSDEEIEEFQGNTFMRWSIQPTISLDQYGAFGRKTNNGLTTNYGVYFQYKGTEKTMFRIGYKKLSLQYDFQSLNTSNQQKISYAEIPLEIKYSLNNEYKVRPSIITGVSYLFLQEASILDTNINSVRSNKGDFSQQIFSLNLGLGLQYQLNKNWNINLESIFKYHPYPYNKSVGFYPYNISISVGIEYHFKF